MSAIALKNIHFGYESFELFVDFSLPIAEGEFLGVIGPNGAGKTTLLRLAAGILKPRLGDVMISGKNIKTLSRVEIAKTVGLVPQESYFAFDFTVLEVVLMGRHPYLKRFQRPKPDDVRKALEALEFTDALQFKDKSINRISAGEKQRVILARSLAQEPRILLLDEATAHLDITHQVAVMDILNRLHQKGITIVFLVHDLNLASSNCSRMLLLDRGRIVACDIPEKVLRPELIEQVYRVKPYIVSHPKTKTPQLILPVS
jgi:iron complex transport system ATP-binding protein